MTQISFNESENRGMNGAKEAKGGETGCDANLSDDHIELQCALNKTFRKVYLFVHCGC